MDKGETEDPNDKEPVQTTLDSGPEPETSEPNTSNSSAGQEDISATCAEESSEAAREAARELNAEISALRDKISLLELILERYREHVEASETKTVTDMKRLVNPENEKVKEIADGITKRIVDYKPEEHLHMAAQFAIKYMERVRRVRPPLVFWMDMDDIVKFDIGSLMDKSILFTSMLRKLGSEDAKVLVLDDGTPTVMFVHAGKHYMADLEDNIIKPLDPNIKKRYAFNDKDFVNYQEEEE